MLVLVLAAFQPNFYSIFPSRCTLPQLNLCSDRNCCTGLGSSHYLFWETFVKPAKSVFNVQDSVQSQITVPPSDSATRLAFRLAIAQTRTRTQTCSASVCVWWRRSRVLTVAQEALGTQATR
jgi:hypothetical protein